MFFKVILTTSLVPDQINFFDVKTKNQKAENDDSRIPPRTSYRQAPRADAPQPGALAPIPATPVSKVRGSRKSPHHRSFVRVFFGVNHNHGFGQHHDHKIRPNAYLLIYIEHDQCGYYWPPLISGHKRTSSASSFRSPGCPRFFWDPT